MKLTLKIWRQKSPQDKGGIQTYPMDHVSEDMSFLEMIDILNESLLEKGEEAIAFDHDCREGICGACSLVINGIPHGPERATTTCQLHMRKFNDGDTIYIEPFRSKAFPVIKDLVVDRTAFDRIQQAGGFVSLATGNPQDANAIPISKRDSDLSMDAAACIGCGACVAACPNGAAMLFTSAKISQFALTSAGTTRA
jgi:succinate dehydrogenase / fumarate reductase iron-sulfur subunit